ncbi:DEAD-domain-containing protein [Polychaeton citri CBS 116435]|uniref:RNA helicase n=1 Tax=Polychaeton citri CBS 116435 TaxID=1314669 RepID=A0A9P4UQY7_9PEZI|nr:DEAD-domain-containing protein [Polychaeton citri CBS 116435]
MSKRTREEAAATNGTNDAERAAKKLKKEKKRAKAAAAEEANEKSKLADSVSQQANTDARVLDEGGSQELSKEERKALKRAKKEQIKAGRDADIQKETSDEDAREIQKKADKGVRKAARAAKKAAAVTEEYPSAPTRETEPQQVSDDTSLGQPYSEHPGLAAVPQAEIDAFIVKKQISVDDPLKKTFRPLTLFKYLPVTDEAQRAPFANFTTPTPIQAAAWPYLFSGRDVVGVAETGSGKTLAFGVPCVSSIHRLEKKERKGIKACIATCIYGGVSKDDQRALIKGTHIVIATPGRLNDFLQEGSIDLSGVQYLVLDEADRMLDKGFEQEVRKIISSTSPEGRQTLMFTATWPQSVRDLASTFMNQPAKITIGDNVSGELRANMRIVQEVEVMDPRDKSDRLIQLLKQYQSGKNKNDRILVFALYKKEATRIEEFIRRKGFPVGGIHGDLSQQKRTESLDAFKQGKVPLLVATDVAARGLDIPAVKVVINLTFPLTVEDYVHRIGRTGRAGQDGRAITFFTDHEKGLAGGLINVLKGANQHVPEDLLKFGTTVKKKAHEAYGAFYKDTGDVPMKQATKITFD